MRLLVCGGRDYAEKDFLYGVLDGWMFRPITVIIHGAARGADSLAGQWARDRGIEENAFPADWKKHGKSAGPIRNQRMLVEGRPDMVCAFPGGRGTCHMKEMASKAKVVVWEPWPMRVLDLPEI